MIPPHIHTVLLTPLAASLAALLSACAPPALTASTRPTPLATTPTAEASLEQNAGQRRQPRPLTVLPELALTYNGRAVRTERLWPILAETAGAAAIEELVLDNLLESEAARRGVLLPADYDIRAERRLLESLADSESVDDPDGPAAQRLLGELRTRRGLGPTRYRALLRRNALLEALTADAITVSEDEIRLAHTIRSGPQARVRVLTTPDERSAAAARRELTQTAPADPAARAVAFAELATEQSTDPTARAGGLIASISPRDPAFDEAVRRAITRLRPGDISPVTAVAGGYAIVLKEADIPPDGTTADQARSEIEPELRRRKQRVEAERLARDLIQAAEIAPLDPALRWSWERPQ